MCSQPPLPNPNPTANYSEDWELLPGKSKNILKLKTVYQRGFSKVRFLEMLLFFLKAREYFEKCHLREQISLGKKKINFCMKTVYPDYVMEIFKLCKCTVISSPQWEGGIFNAIAEIHECITKAIKLRKCTYVDLNYHAKCCRNQHAQVSKKPWCLDVFNQYSVNCIMYYYAAKFSS